MKRRTRLVLFGVIILFGFVAAGVVLNYRGEWSTANKQAPTQDKQALIARGEYLARIGNCAACHTPRGGVAYAGGLGIPTPFGTVYASNLTPDNETGLGRWSSDEFWRALHNGRAKDGRFLYPAFPYPNYTKVKREDADALYAYLMQLPPVIQHNHTHELRFPYSTQLMLAGWRALFFSPGTFEAQPEESAAWNRGAYLVNGLGHCSACHSSRNAFGATSESVEFSGGLIPMQGWYAPSLASAKEAGVQHWEPQQVEGLLKNGISKQASVLGPMAEVVYRSTQYLSATDLRAMAAYLQSLPERDLSSNGDIAVVESALMQSGASIYKDHCADCHGVKGEGVANMYPALAANRALMLEPAANTIRAVLSGGFPPATAGNPRPYGMPPFATQLKDEEIAAVVSYIRNAWGNRASTVNAWEVGNYARGTSTH